MKKSEIELVEQLLKLKSNLFESEYVSLEVNENVVIAIKKDIENIKKELSQHSTLDFSIKTKQKIKKFLTDYIDLILKQPLKFPPLKNEKAFLSKDVCVNIYTDLLSLISLEGNVIEVPKQLPMNWQKSNSIEVAELTKILKNEIAILDAFKKINYLNLYNYVDESWERLTH